MQVISIAAAVIDAWLTPGTVLALLGLLTGIVASVVAAWVDLRAKFSASQADTLARLKVLEAEIDKLREVSHDTRGKLAVVVAQLEMMDNRIER